MLYTRCANKELYTYKMYAFRIHDALRAAKAQITNKTNQNTAYVYIGFHTWVCFEFRTNTNIRQHTQCSVSIYVFYLKKQQLSCHTKSISLRVFLSVCFVVLIRLSYSKLYSLSPCFSSRASNIRICRCILHLLLCIFE